MSRIQKGNKAGKIKEKRINKKEHKSIQEKERKERNAIGMKDKYQRGKKRRK